MRVIRSGWGRQGRGWSPLEGTHTDNTEKPDNLNSELNIPTRPQQGKGQRRHALNDDSDLFWRSEVTQSCAWFFRPRLVTEYVSIFVKSDIFPSQMPRWTLFTVFLHSFFLRISLKKPQKTTETEMHSNQFITFYKKTISEAELSRHHYG